MTLTNLIDDLTAQVDAELNSVLTSRDMPLYRMMSYHLGWTDERDGAAMPAPRQRTHAVLCLLACRAAGGNVDLALAAAAAVELVHSFCEIHDDVQGGIPQRNNLDAVWWKWGPAQAINAGDGMHALARLVLVRLVQRGVSPATTFRAVQIFDEASLRTCEGQFLDLEAQERIDLREETYLSMASRKTGALMSCAMRLGGLVSGDDESVHDALAAFGEKIGVATEVASDVRQLWGVGPDSATPAAEVMNKKKLLPVVYALEKANLSDKRKLGDIYFKRVLEPDDVERLRDVIQGLGARQHCEELVERYRGEALSALNVPGISAAGRSDIEDFVDSLFR